MTCIQLSMPKTVVSALAMLVILIAAFAMGGPVHAQAPLGTAAPSAPTQGEVFSLDEGYVLGAGDIIEVSVLGRDDFNARVQVQVDGTVQLPLIGDVSVVSETVLSARDKIRGSLLEGGYFTNPAVSVIVAKYASRYVTVLGEVKQSGNLPIDRSYQLSDILARVGGVTANASDQVTVTRTTGESVTLDIRKVAIGVSAEDNPIVNPGDRVFVDKPQVFYISGSVNAPSVYRLDRNMTLRMAIARAGGVTQQGSSRRVTVFRDGEELKKFDPNALILPNDNIVVKERLF